MNRTTIFLALAALAAWPSWAQPAQSNVKPGARIQLLAHNAYPDHGKYTNRLDRAIAAGKPFAVEEDLAWIDGKSLLIHSAKNASGDDPTLETYFFPRVAPLIERALKGGNNSAWPLVTIYLDIKNDPPEHLEAISKVLDHYSAWLTTAVKSDDISRQSPMKLGPMMVIVEDKQNDIKQEFFYDKIPVIGAAFSLYFEETSLLIPIHAFSFALNY